MTEKENIIQLTGRGEVYSYTIMYDPPFGYEYFSPYVVALVELTEGPLITARLTDLDYVQIFDSTGKTVIGKHPVVEIGMPVEMVTRISGFNGDPERGLIIYGYSFRPVLQRITKPQDQE